MSDDEGAPSGGSTSHSDDGSSSVRFEDLTVDDDVPIIDRVVRYSRSSIALQRLVHVKMLAETAALAGPLATQKVLIPSIRPLLNDAESVIRQHVAAQLLPLAVTAMMSASSTTTVQHYLDDPSLPKTYDEKGYKLVVSIVLLEYLYTLLRDIELDVRRAAADAVAGLSLQLRPGDVAPVCLPLPIRLALEAPPANNNTNTNASGKPKRSDEEQRSEELRITAANLLAEMGGAASEHAALHAAASVWVRATVLPAMMSLAADASFRVRRCAAQALPRILGACPPDDAVDLILPAFERLSQDDVHRVRKATGECLVDLSRALVILASSTEDAAQRDRIYEQRRHVLLPLAERLLQDSHKMVRQGMMQFLGPFIASFYPYQYSSLHTLLPTTTESDGSHHLGIVAPFFPHATSMVSRLNASSPNATTTSAPTPVHSSLEQLSPPRADAVTQLYGALPTFIRATRVSTWSLYAVTHHRVQDLAESTTTQRDVQAVVETLLDYFCALAAVNTGDANTDAEMRVYCAYSFPAVVLLLGPEYWEGAIRTCFYTLLYPRYPNHKVRAPKEDEEEDDDEPPLPVKRCLASSLHTVAHVLGTKIAVRDICHGDGVDGGVVTTCFLNDGDDSVRLSTLRNFPSLLSLLPIAERKLLLLQWSDMVQSDDLLGCKLAGKQHGRKASGSAAAKKARSATHPTVLNWRQRDYVARSLPDLILLVDPVLVQEHLWPILQHLLQDSVELVREDALWAIPPLLQVWCVESIQKWPSEYQPPNAKQFSAEMCTHVVTWIQETVLRVGAVSKSSQPTIAANFSDRQVYCRICAAMGLALRFGDAKDPVLGATAESNKPKDPVSALGDKFKSFFNTPSATSRTEGPASPHDGPYQRLTAAEQKHLKRVLMEELLPIALTMKEDRISNVRITLMKGLQTMPADVKLSPDVKRVLKDLEEESETWTSFGEEEPSYVTQQEALQSSSQPIPPSSSSGPVDVDNIAVTPDASQDDEDDDDEDDAEVDNRRGIRNRDGSTTEDLSSSAHSDSSDSAGPMPAPKKAAAAAVAAPPSAKIADWKCVVFEAGSIGMQLEPTADDSGCRVCGFLDADEDTPSPARASGQISIGDVIVSVNGTAVSSYDGTIAVLKAGGRRKITFRPGRPGDEPDDEDGSDEESVDEDRRDKKIKKDVSKVKKDKDKPKKDDKDKKVKKVKKDKEKEKDKEKDKDKKVKKEKKKTEP